MFVAIGKFLTWAASPMVLLLLLAWFLGMREVKHAKRKVRWLLLAMLAGVTLLSVSLVAGLLYRFLESDYPMRRAGDEPKGDAIVVLGGGMSYRPGEPYADCNDAADRVWHAARLYKAGRAPVVIVSGIGESRAGKPFLRDLGVPASAILVDDESHTTHENAANVVKMLRRRGYRRVLLVTSAWHLRRSVMLFRKQGVEVIPVGTDYRGQLSADGWREWLGKVAPSVEGLCDSSRALKELAGYWVYRYFR